MANRLTKGYLRKPNHKCDECGNDCYKKPCELAKAKAGKGYCSQACYGKAQRKAKNCPVCGKEILAGRNAVTCSRLCAARKSWDDPNRLKRNSGVRPKKDQVTKHTAVRDRLIEARGDPKCERCGYCRIPDVVHVHHVIERCKGGTNDVENLEFLCPTCHYEEHYLRRAPNKV